MCRYCLLLRQHWEPNQKDQSADIPNAISPVVQPSVTRAENEGAGIIEW